MAAEIFSQSLMLACDGTSLVQRSFPVTFLPAVAAAAPARAEIES